ncbi:MAG: adenosylcobinamide-phosphate synthase CbiB [Rubrobacteraceae bacterium]
MSGSRVVAALLLDALLGEPPERLHPTVWMGRTISAFEKRALKLETATARRLAGGALALTLPVSGFILAHTVLIRLPRGLRLPVEVALISTTLSSRGLAREALAVQKALESGDLSAARNRVGRFVGRDTGDLSEDGVALAAVESVAENTSDGIIAPMLYAFLLGAPGALAYKTINTLDSMVGHPQPPYRELGWASACLDDLANLAPARLTVLASSAASGRPVETLSAARRYGPLTTSPNAGRVQAAFAGALGVRLGGDNTYGGEFRKGAFLGTGEPPGHADIRRAVGLMARCCAFLALSTLLSDWIRCG